MGASRGVGVYKCVNEDRAVSKVVGVVLMTAIVIALAATVGGMVMGFGGLLSEPAPQVAFEFTYDDDVENPNAYHPELPAGTSELVLVEHIGGDEINTENLVLEVTGVDGGENTETVTVPWEESTSGDIASLSVTNEAYPRVVGDDWTFKNGGEVVIYWIDEDGDGAVLDRWSA